MSGGTIGGDSPILDTGMLDTDSTFEITEFEESEPLFEFASPGSGTLTGWQAEDTFASTVLFDSIHADEATLFLDEDSTFDIRHSTFDIEPVAFDEFDSAWTLEEASGFVFPDDTDGTSLAADTGVLTKTGGLALSEDSPVYHPNDSPNRLLLADGSSSEAWVFGGFDGGTIDVSLPWRTLSPDGGTDADASTLWTPDGIDVENLGIDDRETGFRAYLYNTTRLRTAEANAPGGVFDVDPYDDVDDYPSRPLTADEARRVESLYPGIDTDKVTIFEGEYDPRMDSREAIALFPDENGAINIYMGSDISSSNFAAEAADSEGRRLFDHEFYHVAQYQGIVGAEEDFTGRELWTPDTKYNAWYSDAIIHADIGPEETTVEESAVLIAVALRSKETGEPVGDILEKEEGFTVWGEVDADRLLERFTGVGRVTAGLPDTDGRKAGDVA